MTLYCQTRGDAGPVIVLLHGWGFDSQIWGEFAEQLSKSYRIILIDLPGFGHSSILKSDAQLNDFVEEILNYCPEQAYYLGWSLGGLIALAIAKQAPERVRGLILLATTPCFIEQKKWPGMDAMVMDQFMVAIQQGSQNKMAQFLLSQFHLQERTKSQFIKLKKYINFEAGHQGLLKGLELLKESDLRGQLYETSRPQLWIFGDQDDLIPANLPLPEHAAIQKHIIAGAGHAAFLSQSNQILQLIHNFIV